MIANIVQDDLVRMIKSFPAGKRVRSSLYIHLEYISIYDGDLALIVEKVRVRYSIGSYYNVLKADSGGHRVSFLHYADFFTDPHPRLMESVTIDLAKDKVRRHNYANSENPPILHRKETLVGPKCESYLSWRAMTEEEESVGLYENPEAIGFKGNWDSLLSRRGLAYDGHKLIKVGPEQEQIHTKQAPAVHRYKTAIKRYGFSRPIQTVLEYGLLDKGRSLLDYGCGKGDDIKQLKALGHNAYGWDPVHPSDSNKTPADIVNLGFVLNVIEDPVERTTVLHEAFELTRKLLVVSTLIARSSTQTLGRPYKDGILTSRNTFQKYFRQEELERYIEDVLDAPAVAVGLGIFFVFRSPADQQQFLSNRTRRTINWVDLSRQVRPPKERSPRSQRVDIYDRNRELLDAFWSKMLELGRIPLREEFHRYDELSSEIGSANKAKNLFVRKFGEETLTKAAELRRNDLQVYLALSNFRKRVPFKNLPDGLRVDIKTFLGGHKQATEQSQELLFSVGNPDIITKLSDETPFGYLDHQALYLHRSLVQELHPILRIYVSCAEILYGDLKDVDIVKIHKRSGKVSLLRYDDFEGKPLPELHERIKVNLRRQTIEVFDHRSSDRQELLYFKERYVANDHPKRAEWEGFSNWLARQGFNLEAGFGPTKQELLSAFQNMRMTIKGEEPELLTLLSSFEDCQYDQKTDPEAT